MNTSALKVYLAFTDTGSIDYKSSAENLIKDLQAYEAVLEVTGTKVQDAILAVFAKYKGANLNKPALITYTLTELGASPDNYTVYAESITAFLKPLAEGGNVGTRDSGALIGMRKGMGGGFWYWDDKALTAEEVAAAKVQ